MFMEIVSLITNAAGDRPTTLTGESAYPRGVSGGRWIGFVAGASIVAGAMVASLVACKSGEYDGSYDGSFDGGSSIEGSSTSRVIQPGQPDNVDSLDRVLSVSFAAGTFSGPATITITTSGERTLEETGLIVPIYVIASDREPSKPFQLAFTGNGNANGGQGDRTVVPARLSAETFKPLAIVGSANVGGSTITYWGLTKTLGTFSLAYANNVRSSSFPESATATSCTSRCCMPAMGTQLSGSPDGCFCPTNPNFDCYLDNCPDLDSAAARCSAIAAATGAGNVECRRLDQPSCSGAGCPTCGNGSGGAPGNFNACCVAGNAASCTTNSCDGFVARCTAATVCPAGTNCCVFDTESYCAKDCPTPRRACSAGTPCPGTGGDAGDGGTCQVGKCPVGVCGVLPTACL